MNKFYAVLSFIGAAAIIIPVVVIAFAGVTY